MQKADGTAIIQSPIFPVLLVASKDDWLKNPKKARCYVQFNPLVTASIDRLTYRQFDYLTYMSYKHRLAWWPQKRLAHNYIQAGLMAPYTIRMGTILRDSGSTPVQAWEQQCPRNRQCTRRIEGEAGTDGD